MPYLKLNYKKPYVEEIDLPTDSSEFLKACYEHIGCSIIEVVRTRHPDWVLIVDDSGKLKFAWLDQINELASWLYPNPHDSIVGVALLGRIDGAEIVPLTKDDLVTLKSLLPRFSS